MAASILVIDDDRLTRWSLSKVLTGMGYGVLEASSAVDGLSAARVYKPALVLLDINLPDQNGLRLVAALHEFDPGLPILLMSAFMTARIEDDALRLGARGCLVKPILAVELAAIVARELHGESCRPRRDGAEGSRSVPNEDRR
jgi:DNA-binding NtrC family response regulator